MSEIIRGFTPTSFFTDHYELTMIDAALASWPGHTQCVFEVFARRLPEGRRYGVLAGTGRFLEGLTQFRFSDQELAYLSDNQIVSDSTLNWLAEYKFSGSIRGYAEGEAYFPYSPVLQVQASFAEACLLETYLLSVLNYDSAVASAASRMAQVAGDRTLIEMGSRRTHEEAGVAAARAAAIAGFSSTSNLEAGVRYGLKTAGTAAHSFTLLHDSEAEAFSTQIAAMGASTTLLVDTYDVDRGVQTAVEAAGPMLGNVRIDSGDLLEQAHHVRELLDSLGNTETGIVVTSDLDEYAIAALQAAPVDAYGVGTKLVTGSGAPTASMVYKLTSRQIPDGRWLDVAKASAGKASHGGKKFAARRRNRAGVAVAEVISTESSSGPEIPPQHSDRPLMQDFVIDGELQPGFTGSEGVARATEHHRRSLAELPATIRRLQAGEPAIPTIFS